MTFSIKQDDTGPAFDYRLVDSDNVTVNIETFNSVEFHMQDKYQNTVINDDDTGDVSVVDASLGKVEYSFDQSETQTAGKYSAEWQVEFSDGTVETYPKHDTIDIEIVEAIE